MTRTIDTPSFEQALVRYCAPTLAGIKPAALFTFSGSYASEAPESKAKRQQIDERRAALLRVIEQAEESLTHARIRIRVLVWRPCGALVYVYRPHALARHLNNAQTQTTLVHDGYDPRNLDACIARLAERIVRAGSKRAENATTASCPAKANDVVSCSDACPCAFPHEIGFFLGYPTEDVLGFIAHEGRDYLAVGPWKVYANLAQALATFDRYKRCTEAYSRVYQRGCRLSRLARADR